MSHYWIRGWMNSISVNIEIDKQQELMRRQFFITWNSDKCYGVDVTFKLQLYNCNNMICFCSSDEGTHYTSFFLLSKSHDRNCREENGFSGHNLIKYLWVNWRCFFHVQRTASGVKSQTPIQHSHVFIQCVMSQDMTLFKCCS